MSWRLDWKTGPSLAGLVSTVVSLPAASPCGSQSLLPQRSPVTEHGRGSVTSLHRLRPTKLHCSAAKA